MSPILGIMASAQQGSSLNSYESIATVTVGSGGATDVTFSSIPSTYKHLQIRVMAKNSYTSANGVYNMYTVLNADTGSNYARHLLQGDGSSVTAVASTTQTKAYTGLFASGSTTSFAVAVIDILDYANTNKYKTIRSLTGADFNGSGEVWFQSSLWQNTNAINSIKFTSESGYNVGQYSSFALYGIKGA